MIELSRLSVANLLHEIVQQYPQLQADLADVEIVEPLAEVLAHEVSLNQALTNLLTNAVKFVRPGERPSVRVYTESCGDEIRIWVEDRGIGIRAEDRAKLFGMFGRLNPHRQCEGTGIGLAIVRRAVERMGGTVGCESTIHQGTKFWLKLKSAQAPPRD